MTSLHQTRISIAELSHHLHINPALTPGETLSWMQQDRVRSTGMNAMLILYRPSEVLEPFDCTLSVYEQVLSEPNWVESTLVATFEFLRSPEDDNTLIVGEARIDDTVSEMIEDRDGAPLPTVLRMLSDLLRGYPLERVVHQS